MKQEQIKKALETIHARKRKAETDFESKMKPLYEDQEFQQLDKAHTKIMIENAKKETMGEEPDKQIEIELKEKLNNIKKIHGLENLSPQYVCKNCRDEGYQNGEMCICLKKEITSMLLKDSGFSKLENFSTSTKTSGKLSAYYEKMEQWCKSSFNKNLIYIAGPTGVGKTYLIRCMANELIERGKVVKITTAFKMNQSFKDFSKCFNEQILDQYTNCEILFIDDLGTEPLYRNVSLEYLYLVINERKMRKLPTIITSNLDLFDLRNRYDERIFSRIVDRQTSITLYLEDEDKRLKNK